MQVINHPQKSKEWLSVRALHFTASEAAAMMGASKYQTRTELLRQKHTGIAADVDDATQRRFDAGNRAEENARSIVEEIIGDDLSPMTGTLEIDGLPLLASFDGLTQGHDIVWESKLLNNGLVDAVRAGHLEPHYYWQLEQQLLVSGAEKAYFTTTDGTPENTIGMWYESQPERRAALIAGWKQFAIDLANYQHVEGKPEVVGRAPDTLPALRIEVTGMVTASNLAEFKSHALEVIGSIKTELQTDADFADAEKTVKWCADVETRLDAAKQHALSQTTSIDDLFRTIDSIKSETRSKRLTLEKLVKSEKDNRRAQIVREADTELIEHRINLNERIGGNWMPVTPSPFAEAIKGLKSLDSMRDKVATALANAKITANEIADRIEANRKTVNDMTLFPDFASVCAKPSEDFAALLALRIQNRQEADAKRLEAERERIRQEEAAKLEREAQPVQANDQRGKTAEATHAEPNATARPQAPAASTPPIQIDEQMIDDFIRLLPISPAERKSMRENIVKWEKYRIAREMSVAA